MSSGEENVRIIKGGEVINASFFSSYPLLKEVHNGLLSKIIASCRRSSVYQDKIEHVSGLENLSEVPITSYIDIDSAIEKHGLEACVLQTPDTTFRTSGSTGKPKYMYYSNDDLTAIAKEFAVYCEAVGLKAGGFGWNLGGAFPNVSGAVLDRTCDVAGIEKLTTLLTKDSDLIGAMRKACKVERIDAIGSAALVFYLVGRTVNDPGFLRGIVRNKLRSMYHVPGPLADLIARFYLRGVDTEKLHNILDGCRTAFTYAEPLTPYLHDLRESFPKMRFHDVFGSTENPLIAAQLDPEGQGLSMFLSSAIPEIADPAVVAEAKEGSGKKVPGVLWYDWKKGMKGELIMTRPGSCLPLIRYATGDLIEVLDPAKTYMTELNGRQVEITLPLIKVLGREAEALDFEVQDEGGSFLGNKIYSRNIHEALQRPYNIRWWELYNIKGNPGRLCFIIIPVEDVKDVAMFKKETLRHLLRECDDTNHTLSIGHELGRLEILVAKADAYRIIQKDIDRRVKEGRPLGQLKPKRIYLVDDEDSFRKAIKEKIQT